MQPLRVIALKWGLKYHSVYPNRLHSMVQRWLTVPYEFLCLTDDPTGLTCPYRVLEDEHGLQGWWLKLLLFQGQSPYWNVGDKLLWLDLDIILTDSLNPIAEFDSAFVMHRDFLRPKTNASAVMKIEAGKYPEIWDGFLEDRLNLLQREHGDQSFLNKVHPVVDLFPQHWIRSYKLDAQQSIPVGAKVICFHGKPSPHEVPNTAIVRNFWK